MQTQTQIRDDYASQAVQERMTVSGAERLRVLHVINTMGRGGAEMGILKLISGLGADFEQRICATRGIDESFVRGKLSREDVYLAGSPQLTLQFPLFRLMRIMRSYKPHIVHTRNWGALEAVVAAKLASVPAVVHSEHGYEVDMFAGLPLRRRVFRRAAYGMADAVFALTRELRDFHAKQAWVSSESIGVIYNGVDTDRFAPHRESRNAVRTQLGMPERSFVVGSVGRLVPIKDQLTLLKAAAKLSEAAIDVRVLLVGTGPELEKLRVATAGPLSGRVCFAGDSDRVAELLNAMDAFVLPSLGEGMSNTLLEAMACGLPVLATSVGGNPEIIDSESCGWLFTAGDVEGLAAKLMVLAGAPQLVRQLGTGARRRVTDAFSLNGMLKNYREFYLNLAARRNIAAARMAIADVRN